MREAAPSHAPVVRRWRIDLTTITVGAVVLAVSSVIAQGPLTDLEERIFRAVNGLPEWLLPVIWPLMQYGTFITTPLLAAVAFGFRRWRLGLATLTAGVGVYVVARFTKAVVERARPEGLLDDVNAHESFGRESLGFPSGHAAVASALTFVAFAYLPRRWAIVASIVAAVVMLGRIYVGAHLPLDLVGGAALGAIAGGIANLAVGVPAPATPDEAPTDLPAVTPGDARGKMGR